MEYYLVTSDAIVLKNIPPCTQQSSSITPNQCGSFSYLGTTLLGIVRYCSGFPAAKKCYKTRRYRISV